MKYRKKPVGTGIAPEPAKPSEGARAVAADVLMWTPDSCECHSTTVCQLCYGAVAIESYGAEQRAQALDVAGDLLDDDGLDGWASEMRARAAAERGKS